LLEFVENSGIERIGIFGYSAEENTSSFKLPNRKMPQTIEDRKARLLDVADKNLQKFNRKLLGKTLDFLSLAPWTHESTIGRIFAQAPEVDGFTEVKTKFRESFKMLSIKITGWQNEMLLGEKS
jgi:ribosomal protein S12 methylthiotransferase